MKVIIIAGGESLRWANYLNTPKHLVPIFGKPLLHDTIDKIRRYCQDIVITTQSDEPEIYGCKTIKISIDPDNYDADKFLNSSDEWSPDGKNVLIYGDVYFSDFAIERIFKTECDWMFFSRFAASHYTGKPYGENFAIVFDGNLCGHFRKALKEVVRKNKEHVTSRSGGWELYRQLCGIDLKVHELKGHFFEIDDFTEDFDYPEDYIKWLKNFMLKMNKDET